MNISLDGRTRVIDVSASRLAGIVIPPSRSFIGLAFEVKNGGEPMEIMIRLPREHFMTLCEQTANIVKSGGL